MRCSFTNELKIDQSVAHNGVCLTVVDIKGDEYTVTAIKETLERYEALNLYPYNGFVNPVFIPSFDENGAFTGLSIDYTEGYAEQHLRYSRDYSFLK